MPNVSATLRRASNNVIGVGDGPNLRTPGFRTVELPASASGSIIDWRLRIPSNLRIDMSSRLYHDDLATSGSPTLILGLYAVDGNITSDDDALNSGIALSAVMSAPNAGVVVVNDFANAGKMAWEYVNGQTSDPGGFFDVKSVVRTAATTATGTVALDLKGYTD